MNIEDIRIYDRRYTSIMRNLKRLNRKMPRTYRKGIKEQMAAMKSMRTCLELALKREINSCNDKKQISLVHALLSSQLTFMDEVDATIDDKKQWLEYRKTKQSKHIWQAA